MAGARGGELVAEGLVLGCVGSFIAVVSEHGALLYTKPDNRRHTGVQLVRYWSCNWYF